MNALDQFNRLDAAAARAMMFGCCGSARWAARMAASRPHSSPANLAAAADAHWREMRRDDFLEAFRAHPKIGESDSAPAVAAREQAGVNHAPARILETLAQCNREYEEKFGFIFIVCASGKSAEEMLGLLQSRTGNARDAEIANAAEEQRNITQLRLRALFDFDVA